jgi:hypothetical protein
MIALLLIHIYTSYPMSTFERLRRFDIEIHEVSHQECLVIDEDVIYH